ncbi:hypothetical protein GGD66_008009 [Bradyrhizobium sp. CIR48]|nr:hypothetical protein [Bradyrhizobium sp. CIR18]MBB4429407.1 hypothetical protein [Bradyrhizobium sp. CIR48]
MGDDATYFKILHLVTTSIGLIVSAYVRLNNRGKP